MEHRLSRIRHKAVMRAKRFRQRARGKPCLHFLHLGKTGGSAVKHALEGFAAEPNSRYVVYLHPHEKRLRDVPEGEGFFFFLRDPVSRFISGFYSRQRQGRPRYFLRWTPGERAAFGRFTSPNQLAVALSSADDDERGSAEKAMRDVSHVKDSYWNWFESGDYFRSRASDLFFIGFQERLSDDFEILKAKLGLPGLSLPVDDVYAHRNPTNLDRSLEEKAVTNLESWYAADFEFIDLCRELIRQHGSLRSPPAT